MNQLSQTVQVLLELSPHAASNEVSFMLNKTQARLLIRKLQRALDKNSDFCTDVLKIEKQLLVRQPYSAEEGMHMLHNVNGRIILDNY
jgi:hypothetical protein